MHPKRPELKYRKSFTWLAEDLGVSRDVLADLIGTEWCMEQYPPGAELVLLGGPRPPYLRRISGGFDALMSVDVTPIYRGHITVAAPVPRWFTEHSLTFDVGTVFYDTHVDDVPFSLPELSEAVKMAASATVHQEKKTCVLCHRRYFGELLNPDTDLCYRCAFAEYWLHI